MDKHTQTKDSHSSGGVILKSTRQEKGLSLESVHEVTKIPLDVLRAIEEGYTVRTLSPFYLRGFLKIYAKYLDVDIAKVVEDYKSEQLPKHTKVEVEENSVVDRGLKFLKFYGRQIFLGALGVVFFIFVVSKLAAWVTHLPPKKPKAASTVAKQILAKTTKPEKAAAKKEEKPAEIKEEVRKAEAKPAPAAPAVVEAPVISESESSQQTIKKNVTLTIRTKKSSWLSVKADGVTVFQSTLNAGSVETWTADDKIEISGKNIGQLEFELNGKMIGPLGREDRQAKTVVVTKNGLSVSK